MKFVVAVAVLVATSPAHAEPPIGVVVSLNGGSAANKSITTERTGVLAMQVDAGYRLSSRVMLGLHVGVATASEKLDIDEYNEYSNTYLSSYLPLDVGLSIALVEPVYLGAWVGGQRGWTRLDCATSGHLDGTTTVSCEPGEWRGTDEFRPTFGLSAGVDVYAHDAHRVALTASLEFSAAERAGTTYSLVALGVAYRFWAP